jgi:hypothetical protein
MTAPTRTEAPAARTEAPAVYQRRVDGADWTAITAGLDELGCALTPRLLTAADAATLIRLYDRDDAFRSTVTMGRHRFGEGEYRYLARPLPSVVDELRHALYPHLLPIARDWYTKLGRPAPWPDSLDEWLRMCHEAGQIQPTPLILKYGPGDWNALHRDLLVEQRPRAQSRGTAMALPQGRGVVFTTRDRPIRSQRGFTAAPVRHGVSVVRSGARYTLGILFHDAP